MNINFYQNSPLEGEIVIELEEGDYMPSIEESMRARRSKAEVKGFRKGQVPTSILRKMYGPEILLRTTFELAIKSLNNYLDEHSLKILHDPIIVGDSLSSTEHIDIAHPGIIEIKFIYGLKPQIDLSLLPQLEVNQFKITNISDDSIIDVIKRLQIQYGTTQEVMQAEPGDMVYVSLASTPQGNEQPIYLPAEGMKIGEQNISFVGSQSHDKLTLHFLSDQPYSLPNTQAHYQETVRILDELSGTYEVTVEKIYRPTLAEVDEYFFLKVFPQQEITTLEKLKEKIRHTLIQHAQVEADNLLMNKIKKTALTHLSFDLPADFIKKRLKSEFPNWSEEAIEAYYKLYAQNSLRWSLIVEKVIQEYNIQMSTTEIAQYLQSTSTSSNMSLESLGKKIEESFATGNPDKSYQNAYHWAIENKALNTLRTKVNIHLQEKTVEEFNTLMANMSQHGHSHDHDHDCPEC